MTNEVTNEVTNKGLKQGKLYKVLYGEHFVFGRGYTARLLPGDVFMVVKPLERARRAEDQPWCRDNARVCRAEVVASKGLGEIELLSDDIEEQ